MALPPRSGALPPVVRRDAGRSPASALGTGWAFGIGPEVHPAGPTRGAYALPEVRPAGWALTRWPDLLPPPPRGDVLTPPLVVAPPTLAELDATTPDAALAVMLRTYLSCVERTQGLSPAGRRTGGIASAKRPSFPSEPGRACRPGHPQQLGHGCGGRSLANIVKDRSDGGGLGRDTWIQKGKPAAMAQGIGQERVNRPVRLLGVREQSQSKSKPAKLLRCHEAISTRQQSYGALWSQWSKP